MKKITWKIRNYFGLNGNENMAFKICGVKLKQHLEIYRTKH